MNVSGAALRYLRKYGRPVLVDGVAAFLEWGKPVDTRIGALRVPGRRGLCSLSANPGARVDEGTDIYAVTAVTHAPDGTTLDAIPLAARATAYRTAPVKDTTTGITRYEESPAVSDLPCCLYIRQASLQEGEGKWETGVTYALVLLTNALQAGDEVEVPGAPRLKIGQPYRPDGQPLWLAPGTAISSQDSPGIEV